MKFVNFNSGETTDIESIEDAHEIIEGLIKHHEARNQKPHFAVYDDNGQMVELVLEGKRQKLTPPQDDQVSALREEVSALSRNYDGLADAYGKLQGKVENFEADTGARMQAMEIRLEAAEKAAGTADGKKK